MNDNVAVNGNAPQQPPPEVVQQINMLANLIHQLIITNVPLTEEGGYIALNAITDVIAHWVVANQNTDKGVADAMAAIMDSLAEKSRLRFAEKIKDLLAAPVGQA